MSDQDDETWESRILDQHPGVREAVAGSEEFQRWKDQLPSLVVDGVSYRIRGGDLLKDEDQLIFEWALQNGLLPGDDSGTDQSE